MRDAVRRSVLEWKDYRPDDTSIMAADAGIPEADREQVVNYVGNECADSTRETRSATDCGPNIFVSCLTNMKPKGNFLVWNQRVGKMSHSAVIKTIGDLRDRGKLSGVDVANVARVSKATVSRWSNGSAAPHPKTQLILSDLRYVVDRLSDFYSADETRLWLLARNDLLGGETAIELIREDRTDEVLQAIERLDSLAYV